ncbi:MAG: ferritin family protein [Thiogranum sp.]
MSIALCAEHEAVRRYTRLAADMHSYGNEEAASLFERMVDEEQEHERLIEAWARAEGIALRADIGPVVWEDPQVATDYDSEATDPARSTPYRALAFAAHNEERAFRYYTHVAANAVDESVREYAEILAREELGHAALLRSMRRRAWHTERENGREEPHIDPAAIHSLADLLAVAASMEQCLADTVSALSDDYPALEAVSADIQRSLAEIAAQRQSAGEPGQAIEATLDSVKSYTAKTAASRNDAVTALRQLCSDSDRCFAFYDFVVTHTQDEAVLQAAQRRSESALMHIGRLRETLAESSRRPAP